MQDRNIMQDIVSKNLDTIKIDQTVQPIFITSDSVGKETIDIGFKDYIVKTLNDNTIPLIERKSLFKQKNFVNKDLNIIKSPNSSTEGWIYGIILFISILYCVLIKIFSKKIKQVIKGTFNHITLFIFILFLFIPILALLLYLLISKYNYFSYFPIKSHFGIFLILYLASILYCLFKYILIYFFGELFRTRNICFNYNSNQLGFYFLDGIIIIPFIFLYYYLPKETQNAMLITIFIITFILLLIRLIKGFAFVLRETKFSKFYLFVYLCILEILPLIIIYKFLISY